MNRYVTLGDEVPKPRPRFDDPARTCQKEEREERMVFACGDGSGLVVLTPKECPTRRHSPRSWVSGGCRGRGRRACAW